MSNIWNNHLPRIIAPSYYSRKYSNSIHFYCSDCKQITIIYNNRMGWLLVELLKFAAAQHKWPIVLIYSAIQCNLDILIDNKGPRDCQNLFAIMRFFSYILLLLGQNKSFVIPRTSLYRCLLYWGYAVVVKVNKIFQSLVLYMTDQMTMMVFLLSKFVCHLLVFQFFWHQSFLK